MWNELSWKQKVAGVSFLVAKLHSIMAALTMFASRKVGLYCIAVAGLGVVAAVLLCVWDTRQKRKHAGILNYDEYVRLMQRDPRLREMVTRAADNVLNRPEVAKVLGENNV